MEAGTEAGTTQPVEEVAAVSEQPNPAMLAQLSPLDGVKDPGEEDEEEN
jgi:hypothetical protein